MSYDPSLMMNAFDRDWSQYSYCRGNGVTVMTKLRVATLEGEELPMPKRALPPGASQDFRVCKHPETYDDEDCGMRCCVDCGAELDNLVAAPYDPNRMGAARTVDDPSEVHISQHSDWVSSDVREAANELFYHAGGVTHRTGLRTAFKGWCLYFSLVTSGEWETVEKLILSLDGGTTPSAANLRSARTLVCEAWKGTAEEEMKAWLKQACLGAGCPYIQACKLYFEAVSRSRRLDQLEPKLKVQVVIGYLGGEVKYCCSRKKELQAELKRVVGILTGLGEW